MSVIIYDKELQYRSEEYDVLIRMKIKDICTDKKMKAVEFYFIC